ncbi:Bug family tripartite tricarboxylate transporter substrate binding protein [Cupriavidus basilensis]
MSPSRPRWRDLPSMVSLSAVMLLNIPLAAHAAEYPDKPITLVVPFGAGGITDLVARATGKALSEQLGQSIVVENRPGAGGNIAADFVRRARPDGYTLMFTTVGILAVNPHTDVKVNFDSAKDFTYISLVGSTPHLVVVGVNGPAKTSSRTHQACAGQAGFGERWNRRRRQFAVPRDARAPGCGESRISPRAIQERR